MNDRERHHAAAGLFLQARHLPPEKIERFLAEHCKSDEVLAGDVRRLLAAHEEDREQDDRGERGEHGVFGALENRLRPVQEELRGQVPAADAVKFMGATVPDGQSGAIEQPDAMLGHYRLLERIGEGGFGEVWMAEQREPVVRKVAIKIIKLGMDTRQVIARFEAERQALALMDHPNIAKVLDAGATRTGRPFFVMELCAGDSITEYCDRHSLTIKDRLLLFIQVCRAVQHAHQKGLIHRDIKPSNILVSSQDGRPHAKVIDFGIAKATGSKLTEKTLFTEHKQLIGTPQYMSPEQAEGSPDIDTRTDVYSLGVLLYELLTGVTPFDPKKLRIADMGEMQRMIREVEPPKPSTRLSQNTTTIDRVAAHRHSEPRKLGAIIRGDLDWITLKAMDKERSRRYESANELALDLLRHLNNEAIIAGQPGVVYRVRKFVKRNRAPVLAAALVCATLVAGMITTGIQSVRATRARIDSDRNAAAAGIAEHQARDAEAIAIRERTQALRQAYSANMLSASDSLERGQVETARHYLDLAPQDLRGWEWRHLHSRLDMRAREYDIAVTRFAQLHAAPDGRSFVGVVARPGASPQWSIERWDLQSGQLLRSIRIPTGSFRGQLASAGTRLVLQTGEDSAQVGGAVEVWDLERGELVGSHPVAAWVTISPDGSQAAYVQEGRLQLINVLTGAVRVSPSSVLGRRPNQSPIMCISPDGRYLAINSSLGECRVVALGTFEIASTFPAHDNYITTMAFSAESGTLVSASLDGSVRVTGLTQGQPVAMMTLRGHAGPVWDVTYSPDQTLVATSGADRTIRLWDVHTGSARAVFQMPANQAQTSDRIANPGVRIAFLPDGASLVSAYGRGSVYLWDVHAQDTRVLRGHQSYVYAVQISPDGGTIYSGGWDGFAGQPGCLRFWDATTGEQFAAAGAAGAYIRGAALTPDGTYLATCSAGTTPHIEIIDTSTARVLTSIIETREQWRCNSTESLAIDPTGQRLFWVNNCGGVAHLAEMRSGEILKTIPIRGSSMDFSRCAWSRDGKLIAICNTHEPTLDLLSAETLKVIRAWPHNHTGEITSLCFSPASDRLLSGATDGIARVWDVGTAALVHDLVGHADSVICAAFSPDGKRIATGGNDKDIRIWDAQTFDAVAKLGGHEEYVYALAWRADSEALISASGDHTVRIWETSPVSERLRARAERQAILARIEPMVRQLFDQSGDAQKTVAAIMGDASLTQRARQVALQVAAGLSVARQAEADPAPHQ